jgi:hypothetical protein
LEALHQEAHIQIVNFRQYGSASVLDENGWVYMSHRNRRYGLAAGPLANPYAITIDIGRERSLKQYRSRLAALIKSRNAVILAALRDLNKDSVLVCWCAPQPCHAEIIERAWYY